MADLTFQGISSDSNRTARLWQRPMRSPTSHARIAIFCAESPILAKTIAEDLGRIIDRDVPFPKMLEQVQLACANISDADVGLLIAESAGDTLTLHAHGPLKCFLAEPNGDGFQMSTLPVEPYVQGEAFTYVTGQIGNGMFIAYTDQTHALTNPEVIASAAQGEDGLWQLKRQLESQEGDGAFCIVLGKSGRALPGAIAPSIDTAPNVVVSAENEADATLHVSTQNEDMSDTTADLFAPPEAITEAIDGVQNWAKDTRAQFAQSMKQASTFDPRSFFRKMGNAFAAGKMSSVASHSSQVAGERSSRAKNFSRNALNRFMRMPRNLQIASVGLTACVLLFLVGLAVAPLLGYGRVNAKTDKELIAISSLLDDAQSNLIYKNEDRAVKLVKDADLRLQALAGDAPIIKNKDITRRKNELQSRLTIMRTDLRHAITVDTQRVLVAEAVGLTSLATLGKDLYAARGKEVLRWNPSGAVFETIVTLTKAGTRLIADEEDQLLVERTDADTLVIVNPKTKKSDTGPRVGATLNTIASYGGRFYGIDLARGVVRITESGANAWLKSPLAMTDPRGIAVDGDVYVALANEIKKFRTGNSIAFSVGAIDPTLSDIQSLYTTADSSYLYVLDRGGNRLLVINKNGKLIKQYELPQGQTAQSMGIIESGKTAYLLIGTSIVTVPLTHL